MPLITIFGATGDIGSALARRLTRDGQRVLLVGRSAEKLECLGRELDQAWVRANLTSSAEVETALSAAGVEAQGMRAIVNCVGSLLLKPAHATTEEEFCETLNTNLLTSFVAVKVGARWLRDHGGTILLFSSAAAEIGLANHEAIAAAKAGVAGLARSAAATYASANIRVNVISPGLIRTELTRRIWANPASATASAQLHPLGRLGEPNQVASLAAWLLEEENDWITGQTLGVDGGLARVAPRR
jgi:NAD(P)-dependent dehydrogenase (short-subunit alcohol dehydrogenase family)